MSELEKRADRKLDISPNMRVVMANEIIRMAQKWTLTEIRLVRLLIAQVAINDDQLYTYSCEAKELAEILGVTPDYIYRVADNSTDTIMSTVIKLTDKVDRNGNPNYRKFHWVERCEYRDGRFTFRLSEDLAPYVLGLRELFTMYDVESILRLPTVNSIRLFELLSSWANSAIRKQLPPQFVKGRRIDAENEIAFDIEYLRDFFDTGTKYPSNGDFIKRIVDPAAIAIQESTVFPLETWSLVYGGRQITGVLFRIGSDNKRPRDGYKPAYIPVNERPKPPEQVDPNQLRMY